MAPGRIRTLLALLAAMALLVAACGGDDDSAGDEDSETEVTTGTEEETPDTTSQQGASGGEDEDGADETASAACGQTGGTASFAIVGGIRHLNGTVQSGYATAVPGTQVNASLLLFDDEYNPQPYLARSWEVADDGLSVTFELRDNATFHDGEPITSEDVAFSIRTSQENHPFSAMFAPVTEIDTSDPYTVVITLSEPHPAILTAMSPGLLPIIPEHIFNDGQDMQTHPRNGGDDFVGSGPFRVVEYDAAELIRLEAYDDFFIEGAPCLDEIIIDLVPDPNTVTLGLENGDYDMASAPNAAAIEQFIDNPDFVVEAEGHEAIGQIDWLFLNMRNPPLDDVRVRQAIAHAIDEEGWRAVVRLGYSQANITGIQSDSPFYNPDATSYEGANVDEALALLEEAGVGSFELDMPATPDMLPTAEFIRQNLEDIGVTVNIRQVPDFPTWSAEVAGGTYDVSYTQVWNWGDPVIGVNRSYDCENRIDPPGVIWSNNSWYCNEAVDALLDEAGATFDNETRQAAYFEATDLINQDVPIVYLGKPDWYQIRSPAVQNPPTGIWGFMSPWHDVWIEQ